MPSSTAVVRSSCFSSLSWPHGRALRALYISYCLSLVLEMLGEHVKVDMLLEDGHLAYVVHWPLMELLQREHGVVPVHQVVVPQG
jgi:hypothetical protein